MLESPTLLLIVLALLIAYLCFSIEKRRRTEEAKWLAREKEERDRWQADLEYTPGVSFDTSAIAPQIQRLRQDHLAALQPRLHEGYYQRGLIAAVREMITNLPYFHRGTAEPELPKHDPSH